MSTAVETFAEWWHCTRQEYDADTEYVRSSQLKDFAECPTIYESRYLKKPEDHGYMGPKKQSREMLLGTCLHAWVLEGEKCWKTATECKAQKKDGSPCGNSVSASGGLFDVDEQIFVCGVHKRGRNVIEVADALTPDEEESVFCMAEAIEKNEMARELLAHRFHEKAARSIDPDTGVKKKALIDIITPRPFLIGDMKTTSEFNSESIWRKVDQNCWALSFAHYESVVMDIQAANGKPVFSPDWVPLIVESVPPYRVTDWPLTDVKEIAQRDYRELLAEFAQAQESGVYPQREPNKAVPQWFFYRHGFADEGSR